MLQNYNKIDVNTNPVYFKENFLFLKSIETRNIISGEKNSTIRPLLSMSRFETGKFCSFWQLPVYPDKSNEKVKFSRNRIRKQLLPAIKLFFNPKIENALLQFAEIVEAEDQYMDDITKHLYAPLNESPLLSYFAIPHPIFPFTLNSVHPFYPVLFAKTIYPFYNCTAKDVLQIKEKMNFAEMGYDKNLIQKVNFSHLCSALFPKQVFDFCYAKKNFHLQTHKQRKKLLSVQQRSEKMHTVDQANVKKVQKGKQVKKVCNSKKGLKSSHKQKSYNTWSSVSLCYFFLQKLFDFIDFKKQRETGRNVLGSYSLCNHRKGFFLFLQCYKKKALFLDDVIFRANSSALKMQIDESVLICTSTLFLKCLECTMPHFHEQLPTKEKSQILIKTNLKESFLCEAALQDKKDWFIANYRSSTFNNSLFYFKPLYKKDASFFPFLKTLKKRSILQKYFQSLFKDEQVFKLNRAFLLHSTILCTTFALHRLLYNCTAKDALFLQKTQTFCNCTERKEILLWDKSTRTSGEKIVYKTRTQKKKEKTTYFIKYFIRKYIEKLFSAQLTKKVNLAPPKQDRFFNGIVGCLLLNFLTLDHTLLPYDLGCTSKEKVINSLSYVVCWKTVYYKYDVNKAIPDVAIADQRSAIALYAIVDGAIAHKSDFILYLYTLQIPFNRQMQDVQKKTTQQHVVNQIVIIPQFRMTLNKVSKATREKIQLLVKNRNFSTTTSSSFSQHNSILCFPRYSVTTGINFWLWNRKACTKKSLIYSYSSQTLLECLFLTTSTSASCYNIISTSLSCMLQTTCEKFPNKTFKPSQFFCFVDGSCEVFAFSESKMQKNNAYSLSNAFSASKMQKNTRCNRCKAVISEILPSNNINSKNKKRKSFLQQKKLETLFIYTFFKHFNTLKKEKKDLYWPLITSFLPLAFQRRIVKLFLLKQNCKKIGYSQVENFLKHS